MQLNETELMTAGEVREEKVSEGATLLQMVNTWRLKYQK